MTAGRPRGTVVTRMSAELLVIVAGVLIALGVDAAWDGVQDRQIEEATLESLAIELVVAQELLREYVVRDSVILRSADALLANPAPRADTLAELVSAMFNTLPEEVRLSSYDELLTTGRLHLLRDRVLRLTLLEFDAAARTLSGYSAQMETQWNETARPVLYRTIDWDLLASRVPLAFGEVHTGDPERSGEVVPSPEFRAVIRDRRAFAAVHLRRVTDVLDVVGRLRALNERRRD